MALQNRKLVKSAILPSRGVRYGGSLPEGRVTFGAIAATEEALFLNRAVSVDKKIQTLLSNCVDFGDSKFSTIDLLVGDRVFCLFQIRALSFGPTYNFNYQCPSCRRPFVHSVDIDTLPCRVLEDGDVEPFFVDLPLSGWKVGLRNLRGRDEALLESIRSQVVGKLGRGGSSPSLADPMYYYTLAASFVSLNDKEITAPQQVVEQVKTLESPDTLAIKNAIDDHDCGLDLEQQIPCPHCGAIDFNGGVDFSPEFFRPRSHKV